ncbi:MAG: RidA family protein [Defluviitaleaceae bacterium]|nr:RidA family protein [Defluviitaleaceae bacterium]
MKKIINTQNAPGAIGPYSQGATHNGVLYISGQLPINMQTGELITGDITAQTKQVLNHIKAITEAAGSNLQNILKTTVLLTNLSDFAAVNAAYAEFFPASPPARVCYQVAALPKGAAIEIDAICAVLENC